MKSNNDLLWVVVIVGALFYFGNGGQLPSPNPQPTTPLAATVTNANHRATIAAFYRDFAAVLASDQGGIVKTLGQFRTAQSAGSKLLDSQNQIDYPQFRAAVSERLKVAAEGLDDGPLDASKRASLVAAMTAISQELGG